MYKVDADLRYKLKMQIPDHPFIEEIQTASKEEIEFAINSFQEHWTSGSTWELFCIIPRTASQFVLIDNRELN